VIEIAEVVVLVTVAFLLGALSGVFFAIISVEDGESMNRVTDVYFDGARRRWYAYDKDGRKHIGSSPPEVRDSIKRANEKEDDER